MFVCVCVCVCVTLKPKIVSSYWHDNRIVFHLDWLDGFPVAFLTV